MNRFISRFALCGCLLFFAACSKRERTGEDEVALVSERSAGKVVPKVGAVPDGEFTEFIRRLEQMKTAERQSGETLLTGKRLVFDHAQRLVRMDEDVKVLDDRGELVTASLTGRFSVSNEVEKVEARRNVEIRSDGRTATADAAVYDLKAGFVRLDGRAGATAGDNRLSAERISLWLKGDRKMICEPNAFLEVSGVSGSAGVTEIRADRLVYSENERRAEMNGNVRLRDPRGAMNCREVRLHLKDGNEIDWIEALFEVIIQLEDRKALADRATYHADEDKFTLEGEPKVKQGQHIMTGDRITVWNEARRMVCEPNARVLLHVDEETRAKFLKDLND